ncbi:MAG: hypothetical protein F6K36_23010 [Symploca sp. SIO3C6]|nr:hypothetical protein [Symploca sp. SIO3C6]NET08384.1 hypothetical protein [Symploca sp. SIO2B6]NET47322.1 hypothetical protein [Merismopedia sp. SIO2A8]
MPKYFEIGSYWDEEEVSTPESLQAELEADIAKLYRKWGVLTPEEIERLEHSGHSHLQELKRQVEGFKHNYLRTTRVRLQSLELNHASERIAKLHSKTKLRRRTNPLVLAATLVLIVIGVITLYASSSNQNPTQPEKQEKENIPTPPTPPGAGSAYGVN